MIWKTIDSAPKDRTWFLWCGDNGEYTRQRFSQCVIRWPEYKECFDQGWWQPLPAPPSEQAADVAAEEQDKPSSVCTSPSAPTMQGEIERLREALQRIRSQMHNLPMTRTAVHVVELCDAALKHASEK